MTQPRPRDDFDDAPPACQNGSGEAIGPSDVSPYPDTPDRSPKRDPDVRPFYGGPVPSDDFPGFAPADSPASTYLWFRGCLVPDRRVPPVPGRPADDPPVAVRLSPRTEAEGPMPPKR